MSVSSAIAVHSIKFRSIAYRIVSIFCLLPWHDFDTPDSKNPILYKIYVFIYGSSMGAFLLTCSVMDIHFANPNIFEKVLIIFNEFISVFLTEFLIFTTAFMKQRKWEKFGRGCHEVRAFLDNVYEHQIMKSYYFQFVLGHFFFAVTWIYHWYVWQPIAHHGSGSCLAFISSLISEYYCLLAAVVASSFAIIIKIKYKGLNNLLERQTKTYSLRIGEGNSNEKFINILLETGRHYRIMSDLVELYNDIFGWVTVLLFSHAMLKLLRCAIALLWVMRDPKFSWPIFMSLALAATVNMGESAYIVYCCESATSAGKRIRPLCHMLQENFNVNSMSRNELFKLADVAQSYEPRFTADDFFDISKGTILGIVSIATTYLIVIVQFNDTTKSN